MKKTDGQNGFVVSMELLLVGLVLVLGLVAGWVKLRDQSLAEIKDAMAATDTYIQGAGAGIWQTGGTRWIKSTGGSSPYGTIQEPVSPAVQESWLDGNGGSFTSWAAEAMPGFPGVFRGTTGFLVYGATAPASGTEVKTW